MSNPGAWPSTLLTPIDRCLNDIVSALDADSTVHQSYIVQGMPGTGVTRVLREIVSRAARSDVLTVYCDNAAWKSPEPYSSLDRLCGKTNELSPLVGTFTDTDSPRDIAFRMINQLNEAVTSSKYSRYVIVLDHVFHCDQHSAQVYQELIAAGPKSGSLVIGESLAFPSVLGSGLARVARVDKTVQLFALPFLSAEEVAVLVTQCVGTRISRFGADHLLRITGGRYEAIVAFLEGVDTEYLAELGTVRALPHATSNRLIPGFNGVIFELSPLQLLAARIISLYRGGISLQTVIQAAKRLDIEIGDMNPVDGRIVVSNSATGLLHLQDPLCAGDIIATTPPETIRAIHAILADDTYGAASLLHWIDSRESISATDADSIISAIETTYSENSQRIHAARALYHLADAARNGTEFERCLRAFGFVCIRQQASSMFQHAIGDVAKLAQTRRDFAYIYIHMRTNKINGRIDARHLRLRFIEEPAEDIDHAFMQADIAALELISALRTSPNAVPVALDSFFRVHDRIRGKVPHDRELQWIDPEGRELLISAILYMVHNHDNPSRKASDRQETLEWAEQLASRTRQLPSSSLEAVDCAAIAAGALISLGEIDRARSLIAFARDRSQGLRQPTLLAGHLDIVELRLLFEKGSLAQMRQLLIEAFDRAFDGIDMPTGVVVPALQSWLSSIEGDLEIAQRYLDLAKLPKHQYYPAQFLDFLPLAEAQLTLHREGVSRAIEILDKALASQQYHSSLLLRMMRVDLLVEDGDTEAANSDWALLSAMPKYKTSDYPGLFRVSARISHINGDFVTAVDTFDKAVLLSTSPFHKGLCLLGKAISGWRLPGFQRETKRAVQQARAEFIAVGATAYVNIVDEYGTSIAHQARMRLKSLSAREHRIATFAMQGWRNKEIAQELGISASTVSFHLANIYEKLKVNRRVDLKEAMDFSL